MRQQAQQRVTKPRVTKPRANNLVYLNRDRGYRFQDRDPDMEWVCREIEKSGLSIGDLLEAILDASNNSVSISSGTIQNWLSGKTKRPQNFTLTWISYALGFEREWKKRS